MQLGLYLLKDLVRNLFFSGLLEVWYYGGRNGFTFRTDYFC